MLKDFKNKSSQLKSTSVAVIGDFCIDRYLPITKITEKHDYSLLASAEVYEQCHSPGGAGNVVSNFLSLGINVYCIGVIGNDSDGHDLLKCLNEHGANIKYIFSENARKTVSCIRPVSNGIFDFNIHEFLCYNEHVISSDTLEKIKKALLGLVEKVDAIVAVEQFEKKGQGVLHPTIKKLIGDISLIYPSKIILADSRDYINQYENILLKCNQYEYSNVCQDDFIERNKAFFLTKGEIGMSIIERNKDNEVEVPAVGVSDEEVYTCGAGDSATAGIIAGLLLGFDYIEAAQLGNIVASITIGKLNSTGVATISEIIDRISQHENTLVM